LKRIVLIEDDVELLESLKLFLEAEGYEVCVIPPDQDGVLQVEQSRPDALIIDLMLPRHGGLEMCQMLRERGVDTPILMLTATSQENETIRALDVGADDYVTRPISRQDVLARLQVMMRRWLPKSKGTYRFGDIDVDFARQQVRRGGHHVPLSALEFEVLRYLVAHKGQIVERDQLLHEVWGYHAFRTTRAVDNLMGRLRQKLERHPHEPKHIVTVYGVGYRFVE
jgi:two-component system alkaline phosphatase synthesis response regulator PhoP/two-component system response regulator VicR